MANREEIGNLVVSASLDAQQFQNGVSNLKRQLAVTRSEFKAASAELGSFGDAMDKLKLREDTLNEQMKIQQEIVDTLNASYQQSVEVKGEDARQTQTLAIQLNNAKAALAGMADELKSVDLSMEKMKESTEEAKNEELSFAESSKEAKEGIEGTHAAMMGFMALMAGGMIAEWSEGAEQMAINLQKLQAESGDSQPELERLAVVASGAGVSMDQLANMVGRLDMRLGNATTPSKAFMQSLQDLGISAEEFSKASVPEEAQMIAEAMEKSKLPAKQLDAALKGIGIDAKDLGKNASQNLKVIQSSLTETATTSSTLGRALAAAGINMQQFVSADTEGKIQMLAKYMEETKNKTQATALIMQVFGKSGADMLPLIQNFSELDDYAKQLKMPVMDTHEVQLAAEKTKMLQTAMQMLMDSVMAKLLPIVDNIAKGFYDLGTNIRNPITGIKEFVADMGPVQATIMGAVMAFTAMKVVTSLTSTLTSFGAAVKSASIFLGIMKGEEEAVTIKTIAMTIAQNAQTIAMRAASIAGAAFDAVMDMNPIGLLVIAIAALIAGIVLLITHWKEVTTVVKEVWDKVWNDTVRTFNQLLSWFGDLWNKMKAFFAKWGPDLLIGLAPFIGIPLYIYQHWGQIVQWFSDLWNSVVNGVKWFETNVTGEIHNVTKAITDIFTNLAKDALHWGENLMHMLANGIGNGISWVEDKVSNAASTIKNFLGFGSPTKMGPGATSDRWMPNLMNMLVDGIAKNTPKVQAALAQVMVPPNLSPMMQLAGQTFASSATSSIFNNGAQSSSRTIQQGGHTIQVVFPGNVYGMDNFKNAVTDVIQEKVVPVLYGQLNQTSRAIG